jgi:hypothetical protein
MARVVRTRTRLVPYSGFRESLLNGIPQGSPVTSTYNMTSRIDDYHGRPVTDGNLASTQHIGCVVLDGTAVGSQRTAGQINAIRFNHVPITPTYVGLDLSTMVVPNSWYVDTVARSNPSRPVVTPLTLMQDVIDIPKQLRDIGRLLTKPSKILSVKELANQNLAVQFGWLPLVADVKTLLDLQSHILRRTRELDSLYKSSGLRRKLSLSDDSQSGSFTSGKYVIDLFSSVEFFFSTSVKRKMWATIHWQPTSQKPPWIAQNEDMNKYVRKIVLGWTPEGLVQGAWEVLPWTWLIDWFSGTGNYLKQFSNTVPAQHSSACLMNEVTVHVVPGTKRPIALSDDSTISSGAYTRTIKTRTVSGSLTTGFNIPFIGIQRLSILSSLFVQRFLR